MQSIGSDQRNAAARLRSAAKPYGAAGDRCPVAEPARFWSSTAA
jgi:hypothetical protein